MGELTHKAARAAFGGAIDLAMRKMDTEKKVCLILLILPSFSWYIISRRSPMKEKER